MRRSFLRSLALRFCRPPPSSSSSLFKKGGKCATPDSRFNSENTHSLHAHIFYTPRTHSFECSERSGSVFGTRNERPSGQKKEEYHQTVAFLLRAKEEEEEEPPLLDLLLSLPPPSFSQDQRES